MRLQHYRNLFFCILLLFPVAVHAQMGRILQDLPVLPADAQVTPPLSNRQKQQRLRLLPRGEFLRSADATLANGRENTGYHAGSVSLRDLRFPDLDRDGQPDLLYAGSREELELQDTRVYFFRSGTYVFRQSLTGAVIGLTKDETGPVNIYTYIRPCCESYTGRVDRYAVAQDGELQFVSSVSFMGRLGSMRSFPAGPPDFSGLDTVILQSPQLLTFPEDLKGLSYYFGESHDDYQQLLKRRQPVPLLQLPGPVVAQLISSREVNGSLYHLVVTATQNQVPGSLYEDSAGDNRRFVGWVRVK